ncbi:MAG: rhomboid family intramembrane serine protease, partial [Candidatus Nanohaloarchaea archaeon]
GECSECGEKSMSFTCRYCGKSFCSEHRLPENHDCQGLEESQKESSEEHEEWFEDKFSKKKDKNEGKDSPVGKPAKYKTHRESITKDILNTVKSNATLAVVGITVLAYIIQVSLAQEQFFNVLVLNPELSEILARPWSVLTVMLLHAAPFHLFANMLTFYFFASPLERLIGAKKMLKIYIISGLLASLSYVGFYNLLAFIHGSPEVAGLAVGASGGVVALVGVIAKLYPNADVLLFFVVPMKIKTAVYAFGVFESFNLLMKLAGYQLPIIGNFASSAHLAGLITGLYFGNKLQKKYKRNSGVFNPLEV